MRAKEKKVLSVRECPLALFTGRPAFSQPLHVGRPNVGSRDRLLELASGVLDVLHCAGKEEYTLRGEKSEMEVMFRSMEELRRIGRRVQRIHSVRLDYDRGRVVLKPVARDNGAGAMK
ncbi:MAG: hypothetical protein NTY01_07220 [Verrucomicrobia bacterium]|nr:hypothetical protein [Verrucomicrobiota bacterium]